MKKLFILFVLLSGLVPLNAQNSVLDSVYVKEYKPTKEYITYTYLGSRDDFMWEKRIMRAVDVYDASNACLFGVNENCKQICPSLWDLLVYAINRGEQFSFYREFEPGSQQMNFFHEFKYPFGNTMPSDTVLKMYSGEVVQWVVLEDWYFDKQKSAMICKIIGISPVVVQNSIDSDTGEKKSDAKNLFWLYYPEIEQWLGKQLLGSNSNSNVSVHDFFNSRKYKGHILNETRTYCNGFPTDYEPFAKMRLMVMKTAFQMKVIEKDMWNF